MAQRMEQHEDDEMSEILRRALKKEANKTGELTQRLLSVADELGISHASVAEAESEYRQEVERRRELALFQKENWSGLRIHLMVYLIFNLGFFPLLNVATYLTEKGHEIWFPYVLLSWGAGLTIHYFLTRREVDWDDEEFQKWRQKRVELG